MSWVTRGVAIERGSFACELVAAAREGEFVFVDPRPWGKGPLEQSWAVRLVEVYTCSVAPLEDWPFSGKGGSALPRLLEGGYAKLIRRSS